ncbi:hypothetical protein I3843_14G029300 [Carya illinoinensis]|uniref:Photosystem I reaction center subunit VIII n=1 Tax=Carya illinoinensis TaxID=32201 RepID=A0A922DCI5_CARIL|nr:hypothetical protein I3842_14G030300 [Carya illinoinensis]KAG7946236.1 hypothetical protein I3843_14G029300 [Carya illinoinensis]
MTTFNNLSSILVPLVGLVFPAIAMASLFLHIKKKKKRLFRYRYDTAKSYLFFFSRLRP